MLFTVFLLIVKVGPYPFDYWGDPEQALPRDLQRMLCLIQVGI